MAVWRAILVGQAVVNGPVTLIIIVPLVGAILLISWNMWLGMACLVACLFTIVPAWLWWSYAVPRWRRWALRRRVDPNRLQRMGEITYLVWPRGIRSGRRSLR